MFISNPNLEILTEFGCVTSIEAADSLVAWVSAAQFNHTASTWAGLSQIKSGLTQRHRKFGMTMSGFALQPAPSLVLLQALLEFQRARAIHHCRLIARVDHQDAIPQRNGLVQMLIQIQHHRLLVGVRHP